MYKAKDDVAGFIAVLKGNAKSYLTPARVKGYVCPICGSGSGKSGTGIDENPASPNHFTCWPCGYTNSDIIDIIGLKKGIAVDDRNRFKEKVIVAATEMGVAIPETVSEWAEYQRNPAAGVMGWNDTIGAEGEKMPTEQRKNTETVTNQTEAKPAPAEEKKPTRPQADYTDFFLQAHKDIDKTDYHRGLSAQTLERFNIGFVENWKLPLEVYLIGNGGITSDGKPRTEETWSRLSTSPRLIIPTSEHSYIARLTRDPVNKYEESFKKQKIGALSIFNLEALEQSENPVFIVEGELDALSIIEVGGEAVGLGGTSGQKTLLEYVNRYKGERKLPPIILALDNDVPGQEAQERISNGLKEAGVLFLSVNLCNPYKDANEFLMADIDCFTAVVGEYVSDARYREEEANKAKRAALERESVSYEIGYFWQNIKASKKAPYYPTGFNGLDKLLDGGLYAGLYFVGAISSLGKTTFCLQIADHIAQSGHDVLIFSLEMARDELIAKSISRHTLLLDLEKNGTTVHAKTTRGILTGSRYDNYSQEEIKLIGEASLAYGKYARNIYISEGVGNITAENIRERVERHIHITGKAPVVLIDYLQIVAPADPKATDKQNTDRTVLELKRLSRDFKVPVLGVSSFNRDNYTAPVNLASFKESGAIEYSSDVLIGLQYEGMDYQESEKDGNRDKRIRGLMKEAMEAGKAGKAQSLQVKILKNRNGSKGDTKINFFPMFNYFTEAALPQTVRAEPSEAESDWVSLASRAEPVKSKRGKDSQDQNTSENLLSDDIF